MNANARNVAFLIVAVSVTVPGTYYLADYIHFHRHLLALETGDSIVCDASCAAEIMANPDNRYVDGYVCVELDRGGFVCRLLRNQGDQDRGEGIFMQAVAPVTHGEIIAVPTDGSRVSVFHIGEVFLLDASLDRIRVGFVDYGEDARGTIHSAEMVPGDTYVECTPGRSVVGHLVQYMGTYEADGVTVAEFWGTHIGQRPPELAPCDAAEIISRTLPIQYDLGLPEYAEFESAFRDRMQASGQE